MPYISEDRRQVLDPHIEGLQKALEGLGGNEGDLNYSVTRLVGAAFLKETRYHTIARVTGVLENVIQEFYERLGVPYERRAREKNGDVPEFARIEALSNAERRETVAEVVTSS
jgi:hypothetical protein